RFSEFLKLNSHSGNIVWVTPDDVLLTGNRVLFVREPIPSDNENKIRQMYEEGVKQQRGLLMSTICRMNRSTYCYLWFPKSVHEIPQGIWPRDGSLKMSARIGESSLPARPIKNRVLWAFMKLWLRRKQDSIDNLFS